MRSWITAAFFLCLFIHGATAQDPLRFEQEIAALKTKSFPPGASGPRIVFTGSSSIRMWTTINEAFPAHRLLNTGFGGSHMSDLLYFLDELVLRHQPEYVYIYEGDNDLAAGKDHKTILADTKAVVRVLREALPGVKIFFISPKPSISRWDLRRKYQKLNKKLGKYCNDYKDLQFIDVWNPMLTTSGALRPELFIEDGLHMNADGYAIWQAQIQAFLP